MRYRVALTTLGAGLAVMLVPSAVQAFASFGGNAQGVATVKSTGWNPGTAFSLMITSGSHPSTKKFRVIGTASSSTSVTVTAYKDSTCTIADGSLTTSSAVTSFDLTIDTNSNSAHTFRATSTLGNSTCYGPVS